MAFILFFYIFFTKTDYLREHELQGHYWNTSENERLNGFLLSFLLSVEEKSMEKPSGYSDTALDEIAKEYSDYEKNVAAEKPNIIFIMNEAWSDLRVITDIDTSQDVMPFTDSLVQNTVKGNLHVGILGGLTANSEFEALTGDSLAFLDAAAIPYQLQIDHPIASMASVLKQQGYQTIAMHPSGAAAWNREKVYEYMGFDDFISVDEFEAEYEYVRTFISDACNFEEIIYRYENRDKDKPFFLFDVTVQNHGSYYGGIDMPISVLRVGDRKASDVGYLKDLETYLNLMKLTDEAFEQLITYFNTVEEPTIICMFGDHQPVLTNDFYIAAYGKEDLTEEEMMQKYITPYVIWANYDAEFAEYGDMSANYLGAVLLDCAQVESPAYYRFLLELQKEYPVLSHIGCLDSSGARYRVDDIKKSEKISDYRKLQYNHLMEKNWKKLLFEVVHQ